MNELHKVSPYKADRPSDLMFSMSTGALALSVTFRGSIAPATAQCVWLLSVAWVGFTVCSLSYIIGLMLSADIELELAEKINALVGSHISTGLEIPRDTATRLFTWKIKARIAVPSFLMSFSFIVATSAFLAFALANNA